MTRTFLEKLAQGIFGEQLSLANHDELGDLAHSLNISVLTLRGIVESFDIGTDVESAAKNLREISSEQAKHSSEQVGHINQVNMALQELAFAAKAINDNASMVADSADITLIQAHQVDRTTVEVGDIIKQLQTTVVETGTSISQANQDFLQLIEQLQLVDQQNLNSQAIVRIIADIAREIHLLSLNAAIEAARAGENGECFKAVAKQIKDLSIRSTASAKEVTDLLATTRQAVQQMVVQSDESFHSINRVVELGTELRTLAQATLEKSEQKRLAVEEILRAATYSAQQAGQITAGIQTETDIDQQATLVENFITQKIAALVITPADLYGLVPVLAKAVKAGIKVVNIDVKLDDAAMQKAGIDLVFVGPDNMIGAKLAGDILAKNLGTGGKVVILEGNPGAANAVQRTNGFLAAIKDGGLTLVDRKTVHWETQEAQTIFTNMLTFRV
jgi:methyl-accepting chemotaxis protein